MTHLHRAYLDGPFGQIHIHHWGDLDRSENVLICLPPSPYTGRAYNTLAPKIVENAQSDLGVIAVDYPQFQEVAKPSIKKYAQAVESVIRQTCIRKHVTLIGFHTGCLVATETALREGLHIDRLILIDVPFFDDATRETLKARSMGTLPMTYDLTDLQPAWDLSVTRQKERVSPQRGLEMFVDHISAGMSAGEPFAAAFEYECAAQFAKITTPSCVIATQAGLYEESLKTAKAIPHATLLDAKNIKASVLEKSADLTVKYLLDGLET